MTHALSAWLKPNSKPTALFMVIMYTRTIGHLLLENDLIANGRKKIHEIDMQWPLEMQWPPCDRHGIMIKFSNCEEGKLSMVKLSRFAKIRENRESFPPQMFCRIRYRQYKTNVAISINLCAYNHSIEYSGIIDF